MVYGSIPKKEAIATYITLGKYEGIINICEGHGSRNHEHRDVNKFKCQKQSDEDRSRKHSFSHLQYSSKNFSYIFL